MEVMALGEGRPLRRGARRFLLLHHLWLLGATLSGTFVGAFLFRARSALAPVALYNLAVYAAIPLGAAAAAWMVKRSNRLTAWRWGVAVNGAFLALMLLAGPRAAAWPGAAGALSGLAAGIYWLAFAVLSYDNTVPANRGRFFGLAGAATAAVNTLAPLGAGLAVSRLGPGSGYAVLFGASLAAFAVALAASLPMRAGGDPGPLRWAAVLPGRGAAAGWGALLLAHVAVGLREGVHFFLPGLLVFAATGSEAVLGQFTFWVGLAGGSAAWLAGRLAPEQRRGALLAGALGLAAAPALLALAGLRPPALVAYGMAVAVLAAMFNIPWSAAALDVIGRSPGAAASRVEHLVAREVALAAGRVTAAAFFLAAAGPAPGPGRLVLILAVTAAAMLPAAALVRRALAAVSPGGEQAPPPATANGRRWEPDPKEV